MSAPVHTPMHQFPVAHGELLVGGIPLTRLAARVGAGVPFYAYDRRLLDARVATLRQVLPREVRLHYALKANPMPALACHMAPLVDGMDVASGRELRVAMVDSAYGTDKELTDWVDKQRVSYSEAAALTTPTPGRESWLLTHRPLFAVIADVNLPKDDPLADTWSSDGQMVASYGLLDNYSMILASHNHYLQATQIPGQPGALIMGNGGALLDPPGEYYIPAYGPLTRADGQPLVPGLAPYPNATMLWTKVDYGYGIARPGTEPGAWTIDEFRFDGAPLGVCDLANRTLACAG